MMLKKDCPKVSTEWYWRITQNLDDDEEYFNKKIAQGYKPIHIHQIGRVSFVPCRPNEYVCRSFVYRKHTTSFGKKSEQDVDMLSESTGTEVIGVDSFFMSYKIAYVIRPANTGAFITPASSEAHIAEYERRKKCYRAFVTFFVLCACVPFLHGTYFLFAFGDSHEALPVIVMYALTVLVLLFAFPYYRTYRKTKKTLAALKF
jgi:hypothetical protein